MCATASATCAELHEQLVRHVAARRVECDEIWAFCYAKQRNVRHAKSPPAHAGDIWTWTAIDPETKLVISWLAADRSAQSAMMLMFDLQQRLANRVQLTTDGHRAYLEAVEEAFGADVDYAQLVKIYGEAPEPRIATALPRSWRPNGSASRAVRIMTTSPRRWSSARTSTCACRCGGSND